MLREYVEAFRQYVTFSGRTGVHDYWMFVLENAIVLMLVEPIGRALQFPELLILYELAIICPGVAITARRLHDTGRSGWYQLLILVPIFGWIALIYLLAQPSMPTADDQTVVSK